MIRNNTKVKYFILIANDFEENNSHDIEILQKLEADFDIKFVRFPLKAVIRMALLFIKDPPVSLPPEPIISFFQSNSYIDEAKIDALHSTLKELDSHDDILIKYAQSIVNTYGI